MSIYSLVLRVFNILSFKIYINNTVLYIKILGFYQYILSFMQYSSLNI